MKPLEALTAIIVIVIMLGVGYLAFKQLEKNNPPRLYNCDTVIINKELGGQSIITEYHIKKVSSYSSNMIKIETEDGKFIMGQNYIVEGDIIYISQGKEGR